MDRCNAQNSWFIRALAEGEVQLEQGAAENMAVQLGLHPAGERLFCVCAGFSEVSSIVSDATLPLQLMRICRQVGKAIPGYLFSYLSSGLCVVLAFSEASSRTDTVHKLMSAVCRHMTQPLVFGVGKAYLELGKLSYSRAEAYEALSGIPEGESVCFIDDIYVSRSLTTRKLEGKKHQVIELFRKGRFQEMMCTLEGLAEDVRAESPVREGAPYPTSIRRTVTELLFEIMHISSDAGVDVDGLLGFEDPYSRISEIWDTPGKLAWFLEVAQKLYSGIIERSEKAESNMLTLAKKCIDEHLTNPELSLSLVSQVLGITPTYLSAFFIREVGVGFNEYIAGLRTEQAKKLLRDTNLKIHDIAVQCGFRTPSYFIVVFRKQTGMSPGEYRNKKL